MCLRQLYYTGIILSQSIRMWKTLLTYVCTIFISLLYDNRSNSTYDSFYNTINLYVYGSFTRIPRTLVQRTPYVKQKWKYIIIPKYVAITFIKYSFYHLWRVVRKLPSEAHFNQSLLIFKFLNIINIYSKRRIIISVLLACLLL